MLGSSRKLERMKSTGVDVILSFLDSLIYERAWTLSSLLALTVGRR